MALNSSGPISLAGSVSGQSIEIELGGNGTTQISLNDTDVRGLAGIISGEISLSSFYGKSSGFGLFFNTWWTGLVTVGTEKISYSTNTFSNAGVTVDWNNYATGRLSNMTLGLTMFGAVDDTTNGDASKNHSINGIYFSTITKFTAASNSYLIRYPMGSRYGDVGYLIGGWAGGQTYARLEYNLATLSVSNSGTATLPLFYNGIQQSGIAEGATNSYIIDFAVSSSANGYGKFNKSTKVWTTLSTYAGGVIGGRQGITAPSICYFPQCGNSSTNSNGLKMAKSTETFSALAGPNPVNNYYINHPGPRFVQSDVKGYCMRGTTTSTGGTIYNNGISFTFATETWTYGMTIYSPYVTTLTGNGPQATAVDPYSAPTL